MSTYTCSEESMRFIEHPKAFCEILTMLRTQLSPSDTRVLALHLYNGQSIDEIVEICRKSDEAAAKAYSQDEPCPILEAVKEEYIATERTATELIDAIRTRFHFADTMQPTMRALTYLTQESSIEKLRALMTNLYALGEHIQWMPNEAMDIDIHHFEKAVEEAKQNLLTRNAAAIAEPMVSTPKKKKHRQVSLATKARKARAYGRAWRALNPTYHQDWWRTIGTGKRPTLNPIPPAKARALQAAIDSRPQQVSNKATVTRRIPLTSF